MASSNADLKTKIDTLRHEILSYKPGKAVPCDDERVVFPDKLVIGIIGISTHWFTVDEPDTVPALRRALHGDVESSMVADRRQTSTKDQKEYLSDSISVIMKQSPVVSYHAQIFKGELRDLAEKVGCMILFVDPDYIQYYTEWITVVKEVTARVPLYVTSPTTTPIAIEKARNKFKQHGITDIYEVSWPHHNLSVEDQLKWLDLLHGCLQEGDRALAINGLKKICTNLRCGWLYATYKKVVNEANEKRSLAAEMTKKLEFMQQHVDTLTVVVREKERNETSLKQQIEDLTNERDEDKAQFEKKELALESNWKNKLCTKNQRMEQLESEIRFVKQKLKAETYQLSSNRLPTSGKQAQSASTGSAFSPMYASTQATGVSTLALAGQVTEEEITRLSKLLPDGKYSELFGSLKFYYNYIQKIKTKHFGDSTAAFEELLHEWKNKGGSMEDLDAALIKADLGGLVPEYKN